MKNERLLKLAPVPRLLSNLRQIDWLRSMPISVARAPGRLDVMGGIADYSGSLVCEMPLAVAAAAAVQPRDDRQVVCARAQADGGAVSVGANVPVVDDPHTLRDALPGAAAWSRYLIGCLWYLAKHDAAVKQRIESQGCSILVDSDVPLGGGVSSSAAIEVAAMQALCDAWGVTMSPMQIAAACQQVENLVVGAPCGVMDQVTSSMGRDGQLLQLLCQADDADMPARVVGYTAVPRGVTVVGVHSGVRHEVSGDPYTDTRVAAFMAKKMLSTQREGDVTQGHLANVDVPAFRSDLRQRLPRTMRGSVFLGEHGGTNDPVTQVDPGRSYHVRQAAGHHVLEPMRTRRFVDLLARVNAAGDADMRERLLRRAGRLMFASHWSYGLRANLGHPMTDELVRRVRALGPTDGFFGAKITGGGGGGTVAILMRDDDQTWRQLATLRQQYSDAVDRDTMLFADSGPGAAELGTTRIDAGDVR